MIGMHAPFRREPENMPVLLRNYMLAHGKSLAVIRSCARKPPVVGMAPVGSGYVPADDSPEEKNSIRGQRRGLIAQSFCVIKFY